MTSAKGKRQKAKQWLPSLILGGILVFALGTRLYRLGIPKTYYFDEVYHAVTAKAYARNDPAGYEWWHREPEPHTAYEWLHPPIGKLFMAFGWKYLGQSAWAWRFPGAVFGVLAVYVTYRLSLALWKRQRAALLAALVAALDGLLLSQSRIGMNDIYVTVFILLAVWMYWLYYQGSSGVLSKQARWALIASSVATGLAISTKWSGVFLLGVFGVMELLRGFTKPWQLVRRLPLYFMAYLLVPAAIYVLSYGQFWLQGHTIKQFYDLHWQIWYYQTHLKATHPYQSQAWQWPLDLRPVWYWVDYSKETVSNIYDLMNPFVAWFGLLGVLFLVGRILIVVKRRFASAELLVVLAYLLVWAPWLLSPRIMFFYHYTPAVPFLAIALGYLLHRWWEMGRLGQITVILALAVLISSFGFFFPLWTGMPMPQGVSAYFFWLKSWR